ncbi:hypothetical protein SY88_01040 [Clostridiales bacterium PH28_bin88]|nr:hypothetical protein SY88_01040 [Clostridiales bacterium PH28_bin88]
MNNVSLVGRLAGDPGLRYTEGGTALAGFVLAVDRPYTDENGEKEVEFIKIVAFGKVGEACAKYLSKGRRVGVGGSLRTARWQGEDGRSRQRVEVVARMVEFLDGKHRYEQNANEENEGSESNG